MIFVTVGTHEQPFNRLIKEVDRLKGENYIPDEVFIQTGFSDYEPRFASWKSFLSYEEMNKFMKEASIIITHGGPATFMDAIFKSKNTVIVPRQKRYGEHVNDHQLQFCERLLQEGYKLNIIQDISQLKYKINAPISQSSNSNNEHFVNQFSLIVEDLLK